MSAAGTGQAEQQTFYAPSTWDLKQQLDRVEGKLDALIQALAEDEEDGPTLDLDGGSRERTHNPERQGL